MKLTEGAIVWTCAPALEDSDERLHKPRQVKLRKDTRGVWYGHGFNDETGVQDEDSNATIFANEDNVFVTKKEANLYYEIWLTEMVAYYMSELENFKVAVQGEV